jgi:erythrin-vacuolar iron transport family protein
VLHSLPFLIPTYVTALVVATCVVGFELVALAYLRHRFFLTSFARSLGVVTFAGTIIAAVSALLGSAGS